MREYHVTTTLFRERFLGVSYPVHEDPPTVGRVEEWREEHTAVDIIPVPEIAQQAIVALQKGDKEQAQKLLRDLLAQNPREERFWLWLSWAVETREERQYCLEQLEQINPENPAVKRMQREANSTETTFSSRQFASVPAPAAKEAPTLPPAPAPAAKEAPTLPPAPAPAAKEAPTLPPVQPSPEPSSSDGGASTGELVQHDTPPYDTPSEDVDEQNNHLSTNDLLAAYEATTSSTDSAAPTTDAAPPEEDEATPVAEEAPAREESATPAGKVSLANPGRKPVSSIPAVPRRPSPRSREIEIIVPIPDLKDIVASRKTLLIVGFLLVVSVFLLSVWSLVNTSSTVVVPTTPTVSTESGASPVPPDSTALPEPTALPDTYSEGEDVLVGDIRWRLSSAENKGQIQPPGDEETTTTFTKFEVRLHVENLGNSPITFRNVQLVDAQGQPFEAVNRYEAGADIPPEERCSQDTLLPHEPRVCTMMFEVSSDATGLMVRVDDQIPLTPVFEFIRLEQ
jgi:hypothetical protein